jgi:hypothetical protein
MIIPEPIITGTLVNAIALMARKLSGAVSGLREPDEDLTTARWFETFRLSGALPDQAEISDQARSQIQKILEGNEIQAGLQELLAARLTDAPEVDAARARDAISLSLNVAGPDAAPFAEMLTAYYDDQICALVAHLEGQDSALLAQIRSEAFSTRMVNILHAIERHTAAVSSRPNYRTEETFLASYRHHVIDQHGKLEPPDFERRRRVLIDKIYVPTGITSDPFPGATEASQGPRNFLNVFTLADELDRSVLLGDPGGGKTTAANVLMHHFASQRRGPIPFLVTLRDFAAKDPPERSVVGHIEHTLETFYQCPAPPGLVDLLVLTSRAIIIFDGLDELLDTSRRADVTTRVERFCAEYPLASVLVTSRTVGYDEARLDDSQFSCYHLTGFGQDQVAEYVRKWFAQDAEATAGDTEAFLVESSNITDLRSNPLLLALLCILYRGAGSLPRNRAEVYEQCATLLFRRWDARRRIHQELRAGHLLEPALRYVAWWLFNKDNGQPVTERDLIATTTSFLHGRGFESEDDAREAAREFVKFCRGRMWVFSDVGTTASGEALYAFTHRTFLEYFAAAQLAYDRDTPELLVDSLLPHILLKEWWVVAELAAQLKDRTSNDGGRRIYTAMLGDLSRHSASGRSNILQFSAQCLRSIDPSPQLVRKLTRNIIEEVFSNHDSDLFENLVVYSAGYKDLVVDEIDTVISDMTLSGDQAILKSVGKMLVSIPIVVSFIPLYGTTSVDSLWWESEAEKLIRRYLSAVVLAAQTDDFTRTGVLRRKLISTKQALQMKGGLTAILQDHQSFFDRYTFTSYLSPTCARIHEGWPEFSDPGTNADLEAIGGFLNDHPQLPWHVGGRITLVDYGDKSIPSSLKPPSIIANLGAIALLSIISERNSTDDSEIPLNRKGLGPLKDFLPYIVQRSGENSGGSLPDLPVPEAFKQIFRDWAEGIIDFTISR